MTIQARPNREDADLEKMCDLQMIGGQANIRASYTHLGALDWASPEIPKSSMASTN